MNARILRTRPLTPGGFPLPQILLPLLSGVLSGSLLLWPTPSRAQWQPDVRLTNAPLGSYTTEAGAWAIAANGDALHVVWQDSRDGNAEIYYKRSTDDGTTWESDVRLTNNPSESRPPVVAVSGQTVHVVWMDYRAGAPELYYKRSTDAGVNWSVDLPLTSSPAYADYPSLAASGEFVHLAWKDERDMGGGSEIYYKRSTDGGSSWSADMRLTNDASVQTSPSIAVSGPDVHLAWMDFRDGPSGNDEIYYKRSTDFGLTWGPETRLTVDPSISSYPSISVSASVVHIAWYETRDGNGEMYYKRSTDGGDSWSADTRLTTDAAYSNNPSTAVSGSNVHVVWRDSRDGDSGEVYYKVSTDGGVVWGEDTRLTDNFGESDVPTLATSGSSVHVVWSDTAGRESRGLLQARDRG